MAKGTPASGSRFVPGQKLRLPPPPPPPQIFRERKTPFVSSCRSRSIIPIKLDSNKVKSCSDVDTKSLIVVVDEEKTRATLLGSTDLKGTRAIISGDRTPRSEMKGSCNEAIESRSEETRSDLDEEILGSSGSKSTGSDKYPPLFFTVQDFYSVINDSMWSEKEQWNVDRKKRTLTTISEDAASCGDENACFRVTTTNVPFEKYDWSGSFENGDFDFKIEDSVERTGENSKTERSVPFVFSEDTFDDDDRDGRSKNRSTARVRFMVDSLDSSIPDIVDFEVERKAVGELRSNVELPCVGDAEVVEEPCKSVTLFEVPKRSSNVIEQLNDSGSIVNFWNDEFDDIPCCTLLNIVKNDNENSYCKTCSSPSYACSEFSKSESQTFIVKACVEARPVSSISNDEEQEANIVEYNKGESDNLKAVADVCEVDGKSKGDSSQPIGNSPEKHFGLSKSKAIERRKIFIDQSLCDLINDDDVDWVESTDEEGDEDALTQIDKLGNKGFASETDRRSLITKSSSNQSNTDDASRSNSPSITINNRICVNNRRNSFLEDMLSDNLVQEASCKIVETHSKTTIGSSSSIAESKTMLDCVKINSNESNIPVNYWGSPEPKTGSNDKSRVSRLTISGSPPNGPETSFEFQKNENTEENRDGSRAIELKGAIYSDDDNTSLRTDNNHSVDSLLDEIGVRRSVKEEQAASWMMTHEKSPMKKTDELIDKYSESDVRAKQLEFTYESALEIDTTDKRAIDRNSPLTQCYNNDNKAMTPVALRYDQSRGSVSVTPSSVMGFVKQHETSEDLKESNDCKAVTGKVTKAEETGLSDIKVESERRRESVKIYNEVGYTIVRRGTMSRWNSAGNSSGSVINEKLELCEKNDSCEVEREKGEWFSRGPANPVESVGTKLKRRAPGKPTLELEAGERRERVNPGAIKIEGMTRRFDNSPLRDQNHAGAEDQNGTIRSGIASLVPKSTNIQFDQPFVFYCTV